MRHRNPEAEPQWQFSEEIVMAEDPARLRRRT
jgi:hypothetical protein